MKKVMSYLILSMVFVLTGCMEYTAPKTNGNNALLIVNKKEYLSSPSLTLYPNISIDGASFADKKRTYLSPGKHSFSIKIMPTYDNIRFYGIEKFFKLNIKSGARYTFNIRADRKIPIKGKNPKVYFSVLENGRKILSKQSETIGQGMAEQDGMIIMNAILSSVIF